MKLRICTSPYYNEEQSLFAKSQGLLVPAVSVITIVRNDLPSLEKTAVSVLDQLGVDFEYIVVDGSDTPDTAALHPRLRASGAVLLIGRDGGIYDAMSKGVAIATSEYVIFMNAGDRFARETSLAALVSCVSLGGHRWGYARAAVLRDGRPWRRPVGIYPYSLIRHAYVRAAICHQSVIMSREFLLTLGGFNSRYGLQADVALLLSAGQMAKPGVVRSVEVHYDATGVSSNDVSSTLRNKSRIRCDVFQYSPLARQLDQLFTMAQCRYVQARQLLGRVKFVLQRHSYFPKAPDR